MSDRARFERWTNEQKIERLVQLERERSEGRLHTAAIKRDLERAQALQSTSLVELDAWLGGPYLRDLLLAIHDTKEAGDPLSSAPIENTMRVAHPDSSRDEGASTRRFRKMKGSLRYHLDRTTNTIRNNLERDPELSAVRRDAAFYRHHKEGRHEGEPREGCVDCQKEAS